VIDLAQLTDQPRVKMRDLIGRRHPTCRWRKAVTAYALVDIHFYVSLVVCA
jgi:hypothetical protein